MKTTFSIRRVLLLTKASLIEKKRFYIIFAPIAILALCFLGVKVYLTMYENITASVVVNGEPVAFNDFKKYSLRAIFGIHQVLLVAMCALSLYSHFANSIRKLKQPYKYTLPATIPEKYTSNLVIAFIVTPVFITIISLIASFITSILLIFVYSADWQYQMSDIYETISMFTPDIIGITKKILAYGLILLGTIYRIAPKDKFISYVVTGIFVVALILITATSKKYDIEYIYYYILPLIWIGTYILFKRKELRS